MFHLFHISFTDADGDRIILANEADFQIMVKQSIKTIVIQVY